MGLGTVSEYCRRAQQAALSWPLPAEWDDAQLEARLFQRVGDLVGVPRPLPDMAWVHRELKRPGVTLQRLHLEYLQQQPEGYRYGRRKMGSCPTCRRPVALIDSPLYHDPGGVVAIKARQILAAFGVVLVILGHLGDGTAFREAAFWLGVVLIVVGLGLEARNA